MQAQAVASTKRVHKFGEFDLLKAIAILGLPAVHLLEEGVFVRFLFRWSFKVGVSHNGVVHTWTFHLHDLHGLLYGWHTQFTEKSS